MGCNNSKLIKQTNINDNLNVHVDNSIFIDKQNFINDAEKTGKKITLLIQNINNYYKYDMKLAIVIPYDYNYEFPLPITINGKKTELHLFDDEYKEPIYVQLYYSYHGTYYCFKQKFSNCKKYHSVTGTYF
jgi:hypothetical protein